MALCAPVETAAGTGMLTNAVLAGLAAVPRGLAAETPLVAARDRWNGKSCISCPMSRA